MIVTINNSPNDDFKRVSLLIVYCFLLFDYLCACIHGLIFALWQIDVYTKIQVSGVRGTRSCIRLHVMGMLVHRDTQSSQISLSQVGKMGLCVVTETCPALCS